MNREQLDLIPDAALRPGRRGAAELMAWLHARGWRMSLLELDSERRRRGIAPRPPQREDHAA